MPHQREKEESLETKAKWFPMKLTQVSVLEQYQNSQLASAASLTNLVDTPATPGFAKEWVQTGSGSIARLDDRDDVDIWKGWKRWVFMFTPFLTFANTGLYLFYLGLRVYCIIMAQNAAGYSFAGAWVFVAIEIAVAIPSLMHNCWTMLALKKRGRAKLRLVGNDCPTVDVFITCCGEDDEVVLDTVRGALDQDYPMERFRVIVLDDGKSVTLEDSCNQIAMTNPNLYYMAREKIPGKPHHFKAGNLNYGLDQVHTLPGGASQFMAALDADMVSTLILFLLPPPPLIRVSLIRESILMGGLRSPNRNGCAPFFPTCWWTLKWPLHALPSFSTIPLRPIRSRRVSTSSCMSLNLSRMR